MLLAVGAAVLFLVALGGRDLWNPNEPIYGQAVVEMAARNAWLVPTVNGEEFAEKPILYFWAARSVSSVAGGVSELTLRLPGAVAGVCGVVLAYFVVAPYGGRRRARIAAVLLATVFGYFWNARTVQMDILVTVSTLGVLLPLTRVLDHGLRPWKGWAWAGVAAGLGLLAKGPVALVLPGLAYVGYVLATRRPRLLLQPAMLWGALVAALVAAPWYVGLWLQGRVEFLREVMIRQNFARFVQAWDHRAPWWYYLINFWIDMAPWGFFVPMAAERRRREPGAGSLDRLCWVWIVVVVVFFSVAQSKRSVYILPVAPAVAILVSGVVMRRLEGVLPRWRARAFDLVVGVLAVVLVGAAAALAVHVASTYPDLAGPARAVAAVALVGGLVTLIALRAARRRPAAAPAALLVTVLGIYLVAAVWALPAADARKSARPFCEELVARAGPDDPIASYRLWKFRGSYAYYSGREIARMETPDELTVYWSRPDRVYLIVERGRVEEVREILGGVDPVYGRDIGSNAAYLFVNR
jgi:4-amino-4-deoxy-L-arabinose transferase-like glycosyltransferase